MIPWGVGTDILEIDRIRKAIENQGKGFMARVFTPQEQAYCQKYRNPMPYFAARFCAKESIAKALGCGFGKRLSWHDIEINHDAHKKPMVTLSAKAQQQFPGIVIILSMSHSKHYASAVALAFKT
jgi:holo-[acyl-carrier protein] synthase